MGLIKLSIITVSYNCERKIKETFDSLNSQLDGIDAGSIEYIIVDGASTDYTLQCAEEEVAYLSHRGIKTQVFSEPDKGVYDAMNKGVSHASGEWVYMLNAGDLFYDPLVLHDVLCCLDDSDVVCGNTLRVHKLYSELWKVNSMDGLRKTMNVCHQSVFIRKNLEEHYYDLRYQYCADYDLLLRMYLSKRRFRIIDRVISRYFLDGITASKSMLATYDDIYAVQLANGVINDSLKNRMFHLIGKGKREIILLLPEKIRWGITKILHSYRH